MKRACVIGWPVEHSLSPLIHGYWLARYGIDGAYTRRPVPPGEVAAFLANLASEGYVGCNVTIPHKEAALAAAQERDATAVAVGAANTLWLEDSRLCATNTDTFGFMAALEVSAPEWRRDAPVSILGAGGAARAIAFGFLQAGVEEIRIFNRSRERAEALAAHFGARVKVMDWSERSEGSRRAAVLINATSVGLKGEGSLGIELDRFDPRCVVCDIVYVPLETELLREARARGLATVDGLGMLLHQAVPGFEKWFGVRPQVTEELCAQIASASRPC